MTGSILIRRGHVLTMDDQLGDLPVGDVLVRGNTIAKVGAQLADRADEVIDADGMFVLPGLVDTHIHLWQTVLRGLAGDLWKGEYFTHVLPYRERFRPEDMYAGGYVGGLELLSHGTTTALDFCHAIGSPSHVDAALDGVRDSGLRAVFEYSVKETPPGVWRSQEERFRDLDRVREKLGDRLSLMVAMSDLETVDIETCERETAFARERGLRRTIHSNFEQQVTAMHGKGLLGPDLLPVHGNVMTDYELDLLAEHGTTISFTPSVEVYGAPCTVLGRALRRGIPITWGCDIPSFVNGDLLAQLRLVVHMQGFLDAQQERLSGRSGGRVPGIPSLTPRAALRSATIGGATALGFGDRTGSLTPGKEADIVLLDSGPFGTSLCDPAAHIVFQAGARTSTPCWSPARSASDPERCWTSTPGACTSSSPRAASTSCHDHAQGRRRPRGGARDHGFPGAEPGRPRPGQPGHRAPGAGRRAGVALPAERDRPGAQDRALDVGRRAAAGPDQPALPADRAGDRGRAGRRRLHHADRQHRQRPRTADRAVRVVAGPPGRRVHRRHRASRRPADHRGAPVRRAHRAGQPAGRPGRHPVGHRR
jgi:cytosine/adenosine deaminase-related metal-dependent hydrolase